MDFFNRKKKKSSLDELDKEIVNKEDNKISSFNSKDIESFLSYLGYDNFWVSVFPPQSSLMKTKSILYDDFNESDEVLKICEKYNDMGLVCVAINDRGLQRRKSEQIEVVNQILIDIDVNDEHKIKGIASEKAHQNALETANKIKTYLTNKGLDVGLIVDSGNGAHLYIKTNINIKEVKDRDNMKTILNNLVTDLSQFNNYFVSIDKKVLNDINRRVKIPGTINRKHTDQNENRLSKILYINDNTDIQKNNLSIQQYYNKQEVVINKDEKMIDENLEFLEEYDMPSKDVAHGIHNNQLYISIFGEEIKKRNKVVGYATMMLTSDKVLYRDDDAKQIYQIEDIFKLKYNIPFSGNIVYRMSKKTVRKFIKQNIQRISPKEIFNDFLKALKIHMYLEAEELYFYVIGDIITTYLPFFKTKGRTVIFAPSGTGKSKLVSIYKQTAFNAFSLTQNSTESVILRTIKSTNGTFIIDNLDHNKALEMLLNLIEVGYKQGTDTLKCSQGDYNKIEKFKTSSPMIIANINGILNATTRSRCIFLPLTKATDNKILNSKISEDDTFWQEFRDKIYIFVLQNWKGIKEIYDNIEIPEFNGRDLEKILPVCSFLKYVDNDIYERFVKYFVEKDAKDKFVFVENDWTYLTIEYILWQYTSKNSDRIKIKLKDIYNKFIVDKKIESNISLLSFTHNLGTRFTTSKYFEGVKDKDGNSCYWISKNDLRKFIIDENYSIYFEEFLNQELPEVTEVDTDEVDKNE